MYAKLWSISSLLCSVGLLGVVAWLYFDPEDDPGLTVDQPEREISDCSAGQAKVITFLFHNRSRHPVQVLGLAPC